MPASRYTNVQKVRSGWGRWRWLHTRKCPQCKRVVRILGNDTRLPPSLDKGAIYCECGGLIPLA